MVGGGGGGGWVCKPIIVLSLDLDQAEQYDSADDFRLCLYQFEVFHFQTQQFESSYLGKTLPAQLCFSRSCTTYYLAHPLLQSLSQLSSWITAGD